MELCGTLLNRNPSKFISGKRDVMAYSTVFICDVADYDLVKEGIAFVQSEENANVPCTGRVTQYIGDVPSGASKGQEWGNARKAQTLAGVFLVIDDEDSVCHLPFKFRI